MKPYNLQIFQIEDYSTELEDEISFKRYNLILLFLTIILATDCFVLKLIRIPLNYSFLIGLIALIYTLVYLGIAIKKKEKLGIIISVIATLILIAWIIHQGPLVIPG